jgi:hypothetical protein
MHLTVLITALNHVSNAYINRRLQVALDWPRKCVLRGGFLLVGMFVALDWPCRCLLRGGLLLVDMFISFFKRLVLIGSCFTWPEVIKVVILKILVPI